MGDGSDRTRRCRQTDGWVFQRPAKHSCTSNQAQKKFSTTQNHQANKSHPKKDSGWTPLIFSRVTQHNNLYTELHTENNTKLPRTLFTKSQKLSLSKNCPYFIKKSDIHDGFEISTLDIAAREPHEIKLIAAESIKKLNLALEQEKNGGSIKAFSTKPPKNKSITSYKPLYKLRDMSEYTGEIRVKAYDIAKNEFLREYDKNTPTLLEAIFSDDITTRTRYLTKELLTKYWFKNNYPHIVRVLYEVIPDAGKIIDECAEKPSQTIRINQAIIQNMNDFRKEKARKTDVYKMLEIAFCCSGDTDDGTITFHKFIDAIRKHEARIREIADELSERQ